MTYWWVNHRQTFLEEISGGYLWSPTKNKDGSRNQTYLNLTVVTPGDRVFSYADGEIRALGVVANGYSASERPKAFGATGEQWSANGWLVQLRWRVIDTAISPKNHLIAIRPLLPDKYSPIQSTGNGNQKFYLCRISDELGQLLLSFVDADSKDIYSFIEDTERCIFEDIEESRIRSESIGATEREQLIRARCGQGLFRRNLERIEVKCRLTGVTDRRFLNASHIKPWRSSNNVEKLDGNNGLLLSPHVDRLFDRGWISFLDNGQVLCADRTIEHLLKAWGLDPQEQYDGFNEEQKRYLAYHRNRVFKYPREETSGTDHGIR